MRKDMVRSGLAVNTADSILGAVKTGLVAAGTTIADALRLSGDKNVIATAAAGTGVRLPPNEVGDEFMVHNLGANAVLVYPDLATENINALGAGAGFSVAAGRAAFFYRVSKTLYTASVSA